MDFISIESMVQNRPDFKAKNFAPARIVGQEGSDSVEAWKNAWISDKLNLQRRETLPHKENPVEKRI